jgi:prepilin-type N-terminal cleavage/methylation domain-containing protein
MISYVSADRDGGFTLVEVLIVLVMASFLMLLSMSSFRDLRERTIVDRAAHVVATDVALTRSYAIRNRQTVSLVADESARNYVLRDASGDTLRVRWFDESSSLPLSLLSVSADGDSLAFNSRGLLLGASVVQLDVGRPAATKRVTVGALGRTDLSTP